MLNWIVEVSQWVQPFLHIFNSFFVNFSLASGLAMAANNSCFDSSAMLLYYRQWLGYQRKVSFKKCGIALSSLALVTEVSSTTELPQEDQDNRAADLFIVQIVSGLNRNFTHEYSRCPIFYTYIQIMKSRQTIETKQAWIQGPGNSSPKASPSKKRSSMTLMSSYPVQK